MKHPVLGLLPLTIAAVAVLPEPAYAQPPQTCEALAGLKINNVNLLSAAAVTSTGDLPAHCRVLGYVRPAVNFEVRLPVHHLDSISEGNPTYLESLIREDFERCHPGETLEDFKRRASISKEDRGLLRDWMAGLAAAGAAAACAAKVSQPHPTITSAVSAGPSPIVAGSIEGSEPHRDPGSARRGAGIE